MAMNFITLSPNMQQKLQQKEIKQKSDVAAIIAENDGQKLKKQGSSRADVAAVLAMSEQVPLKEEQRDLCLA